MMSLLYSWKRSIPGRPLPERPRRSAICSVRSRRNWTAGRRLPAAWASPAARRMGSPLTSCWPGRIRRYTRLRTAGKISFRFIATCHNKIKIPRLPLTGGLGIFSSRWKGKLVLKEAELPALHQGLAGKRLFFLQMGFWNFRQERRGLLGAKQNQFLFARVIPT